MLARAMRVVWFTHKAKESGEAYHKENVPR